MYTASDQGHGPSNRLPALHNLLSGRVGASSNDTDCKARSLPSLRSLNILPSSSSVLPNPPFGAPIALADASTMDFFQPTFRAATSSVRDSSHTSTWPRRERGFSRIRSRPHRSTSASSSVASMTSSSSHSTNTASSEHNAIFNQSVGTRAAHVSSMKHSHRIEQGSLEPSYSEDGLDTFVRPHSSGNTLRQQVLPLSLDSTRALSPFPQSHTPVPPLPASRESQPIHRASNKSGSTTPLSLYPARSPANSPTQSKFEKALPDLPREEAATNRQYLNHDLMSSSQIGGGQDVTAYQRDGFSPRRTSSRHQNLPPVHRQSLFDPHYSPFQISDQQSSNTTTLSSSVSEKLPNTQRLYLDPFASNPSGPTGSHSYQNIKPKAIAEPTPYRNKRPLRPDPSSSYHSYDSSSKLIESEAKVNRCLYKPYLQH